MNLAFFTKSLADVRNQAQVLLKLSCALGKLVNTQIKGITLLCTEKIAFVSVAFLMALSILRIKTIIKGNSNPDDYYVLYGKF